MASKDKSAQNLTLVFKIANISSEQEEYFLSVMDRLKILWNIGVKAFEDFDHHTTNNELTRKKDGKEIKEYVRAISCSVPVDIKYEEEGNPSRWEYHQFYYITRDTAVIEHHVLKKDRHQYDQIRIPYCPLIDRSSWYVINRYLPSVKYRKQDGTRQVQRRHGGRIFWHGLQEKEPVIFDKFRGWYCEEGGSGYSCPVVFPLDAIDNIGQNKNSFQGLASEAKIRKFCHRPELLLSIHSKLRQGLMTSLRTAAQEHYKWRKEVKKGVATRKVGFPKYKKSRDKLTSLSPNNASRCIKFVGKNKVQIFGRKIKELGIFEVIGLDKRWKKADDSYYKVNAFKLVCEPDGWYLHLSSKELVKNRKIKSTKRAIGIDFGLKDNTEGCYDLAISDWDTDNVYSESDKYHIRQRIRMPKYYRIEEQKLQKLQQRLSRKLTTKLILWLNHPERNTKDICQDTNISEALAQKLLKSTREAEILQYISSSTMQYFKNKLIPDSRSIIHLRNLIKVKQRKIKRRRKAFLEKLSTFLVRYFDVIKVENGLQSSNLKQRAQTKVSSDGLTYENNQAAAKSGLAKSLSDASYGAFMAMLERKAQSFPEKQIIRVPAQNTTRKCAVCGTEKDMPPSIRVYECEVCNWKCDRDINSGLNVLFYKEIPDDKILSSWANRALSARENWNLKSKSE